YFHGFCKSTSEIENLLVELKKEEQEREDITNRLDDKLTKIDSELNSKVLCDGCKEKKINNLFNSLNELINKGYDASITKSSSKLLKTLKIIEDCTGCKQNMKYGFFKPTNEIENLLVELEKEERGRVDIIDQLNDKL